ncbi:hypothetical protein D1815_00820 [Aquimarina sp. AD1]|nr:hypothetical protein D1815_00820 [Aquimarina sp. AD1]
MLILFTSCSTDENNNEISLEEQELKVKNLVEFFARDVIPSPSFVKYVEVVQLKSSTGLTQEEMQELEQELLSQQSAEFVELYYYVVSLNLTENELRNVVIEYLSLAKTNSLSQSKNDDCTTSSSPDGTDSLISILIKLFSCQESGEDEEAN